MVVFLQGCCICSKTELCLPWTESCPAFAFQQGQSQFCAVAASQEEQPGESLPKTCYIIWAQNFPEFKQWPGVGSRRPVMHVALRVSSGQATGWTSRVKCHVAGPWLYFLTPPCPVVTAQPHTARHLVMLVLGLSSHTQDPVPAPFLRTSSTSLPLALSNSLFPKLLNSRGAGEILALPVCPSTLRVKSGKRKEGGQAMGSFSAWPARGFGILSSVVQTFGCAISASSSA